MLQATSIESDEVRTGYHTNVRTEVIPLVSRQHGTLLDVGGGVGETALHLKALGRAGKAGVIDMVAAPAADFSYAGDFERTPLIEQAATEHGPITTILALDVLEHLVDPWAVVRRMGDALAPGGVIVASIPNVRHHHALLPLLLRGEWTYRKDGILDRTHLRFFTKKTAIELMTSSGLVLEDAQTHTVGIGRIAGRLTRGLTDGFFAPQCLIRVRKPA